MEKFQLLESVLWRPGRGFYLLDRHIARLRRSARCFGFRSVTPRRVRDALESAVAAAHPAGPVKVRLLADLDGRLSVTMVPLSEPPAANRQPWRVAVSRMPVDGRNPFLLHKTTQRTIYERARAEHPWAEDVLLWNRRGEVTETTVANVVFDFGDGRPLTPAAACGLLPGIYREYLLAAGRLREAVLPLAGILRQRPALCLINSVRRRIPAVLTVSGDRSGVSLTGGSHTTLDHK